MCHYRGLKARFRVFVQRLYQRQFTHISKRIYASCVAITEMQAHSPRAAGFNIAYFYFGGYTSVTVIALL
jgi:hypothetical protein